MVTEAAAFTAPIGATVVVFDYASVPRKLLLSAIKERQRAFRSAGIETEWIVCSAVQGCLVPNRFVQVKIFSRAIPNTPISEHGLASTDRCTATEYCAASYVFFDRVMTFAGDTDSPPYLTLGYVMAHEIGHLMGPGAPRCRRTISNGKPSGSSHQALGSHSRRMIGRDNIGTA
jgi:hypothetical protein